jgi:hypothetical protein
MQTIYKYCSTIQKKIENKKLYAHNKTYAYTNKPLNPQNT